METTEQQARDEDFKPKKGIWHYFEFFDKIGGRIGKTLSFASIFAVSLLFITKGKDIPYLKELINLFQETKECTIDTEIGGVIISDGKVKKGGVIKLNVHNLNTNQSETKDNKIELQDGTYKFLFCKATTDFVEFETQFLDQGIKTNRYPVDAIPDSIIINQ